MQKVEKCNTLNAGNCRSRSSIECHGEVWPEAMNCDQKNPRSKAGSPG